jgi:hypothetical protein
VWSLQLQGKTPTQIGLEVGIARPSVHRIIRRVERRYRELTIATVDELKRRQDRALSAMVEEALEAFERSKQPAQRVRRTHGNRCASSSVAEGDHGDFTERQIQMRIGDVRYLAEARAALADLRKLYGLDSTIRNFS